MKLLKGFNFFIFEINPINWLPLFLLSFFGQVYFIKGNSLVPSLKGKATRLNVESLLVKGQAELNTINALAFEKFKNQVNIIKNDINVVFRFDGNNIEFSEQYIFDLGLKYEKHAQYKYYCNLLGKKITDRSIITLSPSPILDQIDCDDSGLSFSNLALQKLFRFFDIIWYLIITISKMLYFLSRRYDRRILKKLKSSEIKILWSGVNPQEVDNIDPYNANFSFLEARGLSKPFQILYIVPKECNQKSINTNTQAIYSSELWKVIPLSRKIYLLKSFLFQLITNLIISIFNNKKIITPPLEYLLSGFAEYEICRKLKIKTFVTSNTSHESSNLKFVMCSALGVRTVSWQYSGVGIIPYDDKIFNEENPTVGRFAQYIFSCSDIFVWSRHDAKMIKDRMITVSENKTRITILGPIMSGNLSYVLRGRKEKLKLQSIFFNSSINTQKKSKFCITVFDAPTHSLSHLETGKIPLNRFTEDHQNSFFEDLLKLLYKHDELVIVFKPKRRKFSSKFIIGDAQQTFLNFANSDLGKSKVCLLPHNIDPYIPFAMGDAAICAPFTSALQAAMLMNINAIYYDSQNQYKKIYPCEIYPIAKGYKQLNSIVSSWMYEPTIANKKPINDFQKLLSLNLKL